MKLKLTFLFSFSLSMTILAQEEPIWKYSYSFRTSELIQKELTVDYEFLKTNQHIFGISGGFKWHAIKPEIKEGSLTNYFTGTGQFHPNYLKTTVDNIYRPNTKDVYYFNDTESYTKLGYFVPAYSIPIGFFYSQQINKKRSKFHLYIKMEMDVFFHNGYHLSTSGKLIKNHGYSQEYHAQISKYSEIIKIKSAVESNFDYSLGLLGRIQVFQDYFIDIHPKIQFMTKKIFSVVKYHGLQQLSPKIIVSIGKFGYHTNIKNYE